MVITRNPRIGYIILPKPEKQALITSGLPPWFREVNEQRKNLLSYSTYHSSSAIERLHYYMGVGQMPEDTYIANAREQLVTFVDTPHPRLYDERFKTIGIAFSIQLYGVVNLALLREGT
jgi:hypothetical protein